VTENLRAIWLANHLVMFQDAAVCLKNTANIQSNNKVFVVQTDELNQVTILCVGAVEIPGQGRLLIIFFIFCTPNTTAV
jgi:hypothetical protein